MRRLGPSEAGAGATAGEDSSAVAAFLEGARDILPLVLAVAPFGAVAGLAAVASGLDFGQAIALPALVNAGSAQLAALQLLTQGAPIPVILATAFVVNLRFLMYSMAIAPYFGGVPKRWRLLMAHVLFDQTFAFAQRRYSERPEAGHRVVYFFGLALPIFSGWMAGNVAGAALGATVPAAWSLEFAIPLTFLALLMPAIRDRPAALAAAVGAAVALAGSGLPYNLGLIVAALSGIAAGVALERRPAV